MIISEKVRGNESLIISCLRYYGKLPGLFRGLIVRPSFLKMKNLRTAKVFKMN